MKLSTGVMTAAALRTGGTFGTRIGCQAQCLRASGFCRTAIAPVALAGSMLVVEFAAAGGVTVAGVGAPALIQAARSATCAGVKGASFGGIISSLSFEVTRWMSMLFAGSPA